MAYSQGSSRLQYWLDARGMSQSELARRSGWSKNNKERGWSPRMVSFFCNDKVPMSPEAMYTFSQILGINMEDLNHWDLDR